MPKYWFDVEREREVQENARQVPGSRITCGVASHRRRVAEVILDRARTLGLVETS